MSKYAKTKDVKVTLPAGYYEEILSILSRANKWAYPQNFIIDAVKEKIERIKKENPRLFER